MVHVDVPARGRTVMSATRPEPPDGTIVGWGSPVKAVLVRVDEWTTPPGSTDRWWPADDGTFEHPIDWATACDRNHHRGEPYALVATPLEAS